MDNIRPKKASRSVLVVMQGCTTMRLGVTHALSAQRGGPKSSGKNNFACPAFQERTRTKRPPRRAKIVYQDNTNIYQVKRHVWIASLVGTQMEAPLLNVWNVIRERTLDRPVPLLVKNAQWGLQEKETTMRPNANDATQV